MDDGKNFYFVNPGRSEVTFITAVPGEIDAEKSAGITQLAEVCRTMLLFGASFFRNSNLPAWRKVHPTKFSNVFPGVVKSLTVTKCTGLFLRLEFMTVMESIGVAM